MTLPPSEIERIEANAKFYIYTLLATNGDVPWDQTKDAYVSGAQAEAVRGREMAKAFIDWTAENAESWHPKGKSLYWLLLTADENDNTHYTTAELLDIFIAQNQKAKA